MDSSKIKELLLVALEKSYGIVTGKQFPSHDTNLVLNTSSGQLQGRKQFLIPHQ